ncbi:unnamed protein product, partial [Coregonus sp. 'balchen']
AQVYPLTTSIDGFLSQPIRTPLRWDPGVPRESASPYAGICISNQGAEQATLQKATPTSEQRPQGQRTRKQERDNEKKTGEVVGVEMALWRGGVQVEMELWRHCAVWLIECRVLPESHRVTWDSAQVCELAQALRDGVLLCQLLNNLLPHAVNLREINLRPQMSQFLCLKNIRTFLGVCQEKFHLKKTELFEAFDLFDVRDFG